MPKPDLEAIIRRCNAASCGPWEVKIKGNSIQSQSIWSSVEQKNVCSGISLKTNDAQFIAQSRVDIPELLNYIKELHSEINTLEKTLGDNFAEELRVKALLREMSN